MNERSKISQGTYRTVDVSGGDVFALALEPHILHLAEGEPLESIDLRSVILITVVQ